MDRMAEWLREPGFAGTHATMGADMSQLMATVFTTLFIIGWFQARRGEGTKHHWLMFGGMIAMLSFFVSYYLFRSLGVLAFEGKEGFGGPQYLYDNVFVPILIFHIILVFVGLVLAVYMLVLGFRSQMFAGARRLLKRGPLKLTWLSIFKVLAILIGGITLLLSILNFFGWLTPTRIIVGAVIVFLVFLVQLIEWGIFQRIWPNGDRRHQVIGRFTMVLYCVLFVTGSVTYTMLYILYPGKIG